MKAGKLDSKLLEEIVFKNIKYRRPEVLTRPGIGEDCAVVDYGEYECIISTDPITAAVGEIGRLAIHITCNDIASNGVEPLGIMLAVMLPEGITMDEIETIMQQAGDTAAELGVEIIGGHTEVTAAVRQPVIVSTAIGKAPKGTSQNAGQMTPGDLIYMTKEAGIEGAGIIACDHEEKLAGILSKEEIAAVKEGLLRVSVVKEGIEAGKIGTKGMHDITEGGILGAVWELCEISKTGAEIWKDKIPVSEGTKKICDHFNIDYLRLISSGCMLIVVSEEKKAAMEAAMDRIKVPFTCIGKVVEQDKGKTLADGKNRQEIAPPASDELYKVL